MYSDVCAPSLCETITYHLIRTYYTYQHTLAVIYSCLSYSSHGIFHFIQRFEYNRWWQRRRLMCVSLN